MDSPNANDPRKFLRLLDQQASDCFQERFRFVLVIGVWIIFNWVVFFFFLNADIVGLTRLWELIFSFKLSFLNLKETVSYHQEIFVFDKGEGNSNLSPQH